MVVVGIRLPTRMTMTMTTTMMTMRISEKLGLLAGREGMVFSLSDHLKRGSEGLPLSAESTFRIRILPDLVAAGSLEVIWYESC